MKKLICLLAPVMTLTLAATSCSGSGSDSGEKLTDSVYVGDGYEIPGVLFHGADGYDYYVIPPLPGVELTFDEAKAMEKDGWVLPKSMGHYEKMDQGGVNGQILEYKTIHTDSDEPVIERMMGDPRLLVTVLPDLSFPLMVGTGEYWTGTRLDQTHAVYYSVRQTPGGLQMSSITDHGDPTSNQKKVVLVKRIAPRTDAVMYTNPVSGRQFPAHLLRGWAIVDPSGGLNFSFVTPSAARYAHDYDYPNGVTDVTEYETRTWTLPDCNMLSKLFETRIEPKSSVLVQTTDAIKRAFPPSNGPSWHAYLGRDARGDYFTYSIYHFNDGSTRITTGSAPGSYGTRVRLFMPSGLTDSADNKPGADVPYKDSDTPDKTLCDLKGPVASVAWIHADADMPYQTVEFTPQGQIVAPSDVKVERDSQGRIVKYEKFVGPDSDANFEHCLTYSGNSNRPTSYSDSNIAHIASYTFRYDSEGNLADETSKESYEGETDEYHGKTTYTILKRDSHGNWTSRRQECTLITKSEVYENEEWQMRQDTTVTTITVNRTITYGTE